MQSTARCAPQFAAALAAGAQYPRMGRALYIESVEDAASIAGGYERLAAALGVSADQVRSWSSGASIPECAVFLRLIELLLNAMPSKDPAPRVECGTGGLTAAPEAG